MQGVAFNAARTIVEFVAFTVLARRRTLCVGGTTAKSGEARALEAMTMVSTLRKILCRTRLSHDWRTVSSPDGEQRYLACSVCGKERPGGGGAAPIVG